MAQELMLRLISGNKIVGYELHSIGLCFQGDSPESCSFEVYGDTEGEYILYDSLELGVKVGETWFFSGDVVENVHGKCELFFDGFSFAIKTQTGNIFYFDGLLQKDAKKIGTIHEVIKCL